MSPTVACSSGSMAATLRWPTCSAGPARRAGNEAHRTTAHSAPAFWTICSARCACSSPRPDSKTRRRTPARTRHLGEGARRLHRARHSRVWVIGHIHRPDAAHRRLPARRIVPVERRVDGAGSDRHRPPAPTAALPRGGWSCPPAQHERGRHRRPPARVRSRFMCPASLASLKAASRVQLTGMVWDATRHEPSSQGLHSRSTCAARQGCPLGTQCAACGGSAEGAV